MVGVRAIFKIETPVVSKRSIKERLEGWKGDHAVVRINGQGEKQRNCKVRRKEEREKMKNGVALDDDSL